MAFVGALACSAIILSTTAKDSLACGIFSLAKAENIFCASGRFCGTILPLAMLLFIQVAVHHFISRDLRRQTAFISPDRSITGVPQKRP